MKSLNSKSIIRNILYFLWVILTAASYFGIANLLKQSLINITLEDLIYYISMIVLAEFHFAKGKIEIIFYF